MTDFDKVMVDPETGVTRLLRIGTFDIEATALDATRGYLLCASVKEVNPRDFKGKTYTLRIDDKRNPNQFSDEWICEELVSFLNSFDLLLGWNSSQYDFPFVNSRCIKHGILPPQRNFRRDLLYCAKSSCRIGGNSLANWGKFCFGATGKTSLNWDIWLQAMRGDTKSLNYIVEHNIKDVLETERIYKKLFPLLGKLKRK